MKLAKLVKKTSEILPAVTIEEIEGFCMGGDEDALEIVTPEELAEQIKEYMGLTRRANKMEKYRLVVGEIGSERGHIIATSAKTEAGAKIALGKALAKYEGDGWGYIEMLWVSAKESQSGHDEWDQIE